MQLNVINHLGAVRRGRGVGAADLARRVGVSRQTIYAIEAGTYMPNTEVSLKLARALEVSVEELFALAEESGRPQPPLQAEVLSTGPVPPGQPVQLCRLGDRLIGIPVNAVPYFLPEADGVAGKPGSRRKADVLVFSPEESFAKRIILAGCDPALGLLGRMVERLSGVEVVTAPASSKLALDWLKACKVHIAGTHLKDGQTGEFNTPIVQRDYPGEDFTVVTFARWEEGFVTAPGNPKRIRDVADMAGSGLRFVNRETGSGSRALFESLLQQRDIAATTVAGHDRIALGHLAAAYAVRCGDADCCIATRSAARAFGLDFIPLQSERYDFALRRSALEFVAIQSFLDVLQKASLRRKLEALAGYDTTDTGAVVM